MKTVYADLTADSNTGSIQLAVKECPFCTKRHPHGLSEGPKDSPCYYNEGGVMLQGGTYNIKIDWTDPAHTELKERYESLTKSTK